jgi:catechol 2,3-dioxygenase
MEIKALGHVVLQVSNMERSIGFYADFLGLPICARDGEKMTFFSLGNHHDFAIAALGDDAERPNSHATGLAHVAFNIGNDMSELLDAKSRLDDAGISYTPIDHEVTKSLYLQDPDGNGVELYVDASDAWKEDPQRVAQVMPLEL